MEFEGIEVASGQYAVTLVPNFHIIDGRLMIDMAGCEDITPDRRPIISLLNYCLLSKLPTLKIITVIPLSALLEDEIKMNVPKYYEYYKDLLTEENINRGLVSTVFLITKVDKYGVQMFGGRNTGLSIKDSFEFQVGKYGARLAARKGIESQLVASIQANSVLIDYSTGKSTILEELWDKLKVAEPMNAELIRLDVKGVTNVIVNQCLSVTKKLSEKIDELIDMTLRQDSLISTKEQQISDIMKNTDKLGSIIIDYEQTTIKRKEISDLIVKLGVEEESLNDKMLDLESQMREVKDQQQAFVIKYEGFVIMFPTILFSTTRDGKDKIYVEHLTRPGSVRPTETIMLDYDVYRRVEKSIISSLTAESIYSLKLPVLPTGKNVSLIVRDGRIIVHASNDKRFVLILMDTVNVRETAFKPLFSANYEERIKTIEDFMAVTDTKLRVRNDRNLVATNEQLSLESKLKDLKSEFQAIKTKCVKKFDDINKLVSESLETMRKIKEVLFMLHQDRTIMITKQIGDVLKQSNLDGGMIDEITKNSDRLDKLNKTSEQIVDHGEKVILKLRQSYLEIEKYLL